MEAILCACCTHPTPTPSTPHTHLQHISLRCISEESRCPPPSSTLYSTLYAHSYPPTPEIYAVDSPGLLRISPLFCASPPPSMHYAVPGEGGFCLPPIGGSFRFSADSAFRVRKIDNGSGERVIRGCSPPRVGDSSWLQHRLQPMARPAGAAPRSMCRHLPGRNERCFMGATLPPPYGRPTPLFSNTLLSSPLKIGLFERLKNIPETHLISIFPFFVFCF